VLLLLALVTVLVASTLLLSQIERRAAAQTAKTERARQNALFALDVALNQLQKEAGPDQRITARAEILDSAPDTIAIDGVTQPYWSGVWKTGVAPLDVGANPQRTTSLGSLSPTATQKADKAVWLVSNPDPATAVTPLTWTGTISGNIPTRNAVVMAKKYGPDSATVTVPLVPVLGEASANPADATGGYAYWVSDEGIKARVNIQDPTLGISPSTDPSLNQVHFLGGQAAAGHKALSEFANQDIRGDANASKPATLNALVHLTGLSSFDDRSAARIRPDVTLHSYGLLTDVRRGGLKKDLTAALESTTSFTTLTNNYGNGAQMLYRTASSANVTVPTIDTGVSPPIDGLLWHNLFVHYNAYKTSMPAPAPMSTGGAAPITPTSSGSPASLPQVLSPRTYAVSQGGAAVHLGSLAPVPVAYRVDVALSSYRDTGTGLWKLRLHYYPQLVLWNPYSVRLNLANYQFQRNVGAFATAGSYAALSVTCVRITTTTAGIPTSIPPFLVNQSSAGRLILKTKTGDCATLEPGQTRMFALDSDAVMGTPLDAISFNSLSSNTNTTADYSQQCDVLTGVNPATGMSTGSTPFSTPDPNTLVSVSLTAPSLRCQNVDTFTLPNGVKWPWNGGTIRCMAGGDWNLAAASSTWPATLTISQLNGAPRRLIGFYVRQKGLRTTSSSLTYSNASVTIPPFMGNSPTLNPVEDLFSFGWQEVYLSPLGTTYTNGQTDVQTMLSGSHLESSYGTDSAGSAAPGSRCVLRDVPNQPMVSLGQFMHMPASNFWSIGNYQLLAMGSMFVGGSYASPILQPTTNALTAAFGTVAGGGPNNKIFLDDSYLANEALFDRFFFSTVPPQTIPANSPAVWTDFNNANNGTNLSDSSKILLNPRIKPYLKKMTNPAMADLRDPEKAAAHLMVEGAFNTNSTSVAAWKAYLGGTAGNDLRMWNAASNSPSTLSTSTDCLIPRFWSASGTLNANQLWSGMRLLSNTNLDDLATQIVQQVKIRGPFLSMADFLNRRLGAPGPLTLSGALQAAIDSTNLNTPIKSGIPTVNASSPPESGKLPSMIAANMQDSAGNTWNSALGVPGYLMQQDLVQTYGPLMSVRSDTFVVRCYGESNNVANGAIEGRAWGEALVQRLPDFVDPTDPALTTGANLGDATPPVSTNTTNQTFGRRFQVVSFRWLHEKEI
jgi:hypothetical protein